MTTFRRGDGVVFVRTAREYVIGQPSKERQDITVGMVTSVTRDGEIKAYRHGPWSTDVKLHKGSAERYATKYVLPKDKVNVPGVLDYCASRPWSHSPEHKGMPFSSLEELRAELKQFRASE